MHRFLNTFQRLDSVEMVNFIELDSSVREENPTIILGKNILLKIVEDPSKQALLKNKDVRKFVSIPNLCNDEIRGLIQALLEHETYLTAPSFLQLLVQGKDKLKELEPHLHWLEQILAPIKEAKIFKVLEESTHEKFAEDEFRKKLTQRKDLMADIMFRIKGEISKEQLSEYEKKFMSIARELEKKTGVWIAVPSTLFLCPKCKRILFANEIVNKKCLSCNRKISEETVDRIPIYKTREEIKRVWGSNLWFEAYFANLLRKLGFQTWVGVHSMGVSGILHEVDVLAIRRGTAIVAECKTGRISRNHVFNFCTKVGDLRAHIAILALVEELPEPETREFVKRNPALIGLENMGKRKETDILTDLKTRLSIKA